MLCVVILMESDVLERKGACSLNLSEGAKLVAAGGWRLPRKYANQKKVIQLEKR